MKRLRRSLGGNRDAEWERRMDGFDDFESQAKISEPSQVSIHWNSSDSEEDSVKADERNEKGKAETHSEPSSARSGINVAARNYTRKRRVLEKNIDNITEQNKTKKTTGDHNDIFHKTNHSQHSAPSSNHIRRKQKRVRPDKNFEEGSVYQISEISSPNQENMRGKFSNYHSAHNQIALQENIQKDTAQSATFYSAISRTSKNLIDIFNETEKQVSFKEFKNCASSRQKFDLDAISTECCLQLEVKTKRRLLIENKHSQCAETSSNIPETNKHNEGVREAHSKRKTSNNSNESQINYRKVVHISATLEGNGDTPEKDVDIECIQSQYKTQPSENTDNLNKEDSTPLSLNSVTSQAISDYDSDTNVNGMHAGCTDPSCDLCQLLKPRPSPPVLSLSPAISTPTTPVKVVEVKHRASKDVAHKVIADHDGLTAKVKEGSEFKVKASDWAQTVQEALVVTPRKPATDLEENQAGWDSAKKKKMKYIRDGLADRLQRLVNREKSSYAIWSHKRQHQAKADISKTMLVLVQTVTKKYSLAECQCQILEQPSSTSSSPIIDPAIKLAATNLKDRDIEFQSNIGNCDPKAGKDEKNSSLSCSFIESSERTNRFPSQTDCESGFTSVNSASRGSGLVVVLFSGTLASKLKTGCMIRIYPPWQRLKLHRKPTFILCTQYSAIVDVDVSKACASNDVCNDNVHYKDKEDQIKWEHSASWTCPCVLNNSLPSTRCPAYVIPCQTSKVCSQKLHTKTSPPIESETSDCLQTVGFKDIKSEESDILSAVESGLGGQSVCFAALVHKICDRRVKSTSGNQHSWQGNYSLVLQDRHSTLCELQVPAHCADQSEWKTLLTSGCGHVFMFKGVRAGQRTNRARHPSLFSVLDRIWSSSKSHKTSTTCAGFAYILKAVLGESTCSASDVTLGHSVTYAQPRVTSLQDALTSQITRCCLKVNCLYAHREESETVLYICDDSSAALPLYVDNTILCSYSHIVKQELQLVDVYCKKGRLVLDGYSTVACLQPVCSVEFERMIAQFSCDCKPLDLVNLSGTVCGVDEGSAFSWLSCPICCKDSLTGGTSTNPFLFCTACARGVQEPVTHLSMTVQVACHTLDSPSVKVKLLQKTIETLLPPEKNDDGYDMESVLGQNIGPISCIVVRSSTYEQIILQEIDIESQN